MSSNQLPGCYLLIVLADPLYPHHIDKIIAKVAKGLLSLDCERYECDLNEIEQVSSAIASSAVEDGEIILQHSSDKLAVEILRQPLVYTLKQCIKNCLLSPTGHKHIIHAGYTFADSGSWMLSDGSLDISDFFSILREADVEQQLKETHQQWQLHVHATNHADWNDKTFAKLISSTNDNKVKYNIQFNPTITLTEEEKSARECQHLLDFLADCLKGSSDASDYMEQSDVVGSIRFNKPTLYVFPSGQGDCSLFGITGFTMLIDGGFSPQPCFWSFVRHLERLDTIMITRLNEKNLGGFSSFFKKKLVTTSLYPNIGYVLCNNLMTNSRVTDEQKETANADEIMADEDELIICVIEASKMLLGNIKNVGLDARSCLRDSTIVPITLYHKVGHGTLDLFILNPTNDTKLLQTFHMQSEKKKQEFIKVTSALDDSVQIKLPLSNLMSICCLLVWKPSEANDNIIRILFTGSTPQFKIFDGLNKLQTLDILQYGNCTRNLLREKINAKSKNNTTVRLRSVSPTHKSRVTSTVHKSPASASAGGGGRSESTRSTRAQQRTPPLPPVTRTSSVSATRKATQPLKEDKTENGKKCTPMRENNQRRESDTSGKQVTDAEDADEAITAFVGHLQDDDSTDNDICKLSGEITSIDKDRVHAARGIVCDAEETSDNSGDPQTLVIDGATLENNTEHNDAPQCVSEDNNEIMKSIEQDEARGHKVAASSAEADETNTAKDEEHNNLINEAETAAVAEKMESSDILHEASPPSRKQSLAESKSSKVSSRRSSVAGEVEESRARASDSRRSSVASVRGSIGRRVSSASSAPVNREASQSRKSSQVSDAVHSEVKQVAPASTSRKASAAISNKSSPVTSRRSSIARELTSGNFSRKNSLSQQPIQVRRESISKQLDVKFTSDSSPAASSPISPNVSRKGSLTTDIKSSPIVSRRSSIDKASSRRSSVVSMKGSEITAPEMKSTQGPSETALTSQEQSTILPPTSEPADLATNSIDNEGKLCQDNEFTEKGSIDGEISKSIISTADELFNTLASVKSESTQLQSDHASEIIQEHHVNIETMSEAAKNVTGDELTRTSDTKSTEGSSRRRESQQLQGEEARESNADVKVEEASGEADKEQEKEEEKEKEEKEEEESALLERKQSIALTSENQIEEKETSILVDESIASETHENTEANYSREIEQHGDARDEKCIEGDIDEICHEKERDVDEKKTPSGMENVQSGDISLSQAIESKEKTQQSVREATEEKSGITDEPSKVTSIDTDDEEAPVSRVTSRKGSSAIESESSPAIASQVTGQQVDDGSNRNAELENVLIEASSLDSDSKSSRKQSVAEDRIEPVQGDNLDKSTHSFAETATNQDAAPSIALAADQNDESDRRRSITGEITIEKSETHETAADVGADEETKSSAASVRTKRSTVPQDNSDDAAGLPAEESILIGEKEMEKNNEKQDYEKEDNEREDERKEGLLQDNEREEVKNDETQCGQEREDISREMQEITEARQSVTSSSEKNKIQLQHANDRVDQVGSTFDTEIVKTQDDAITVDESGAGEVTEISTIESPDQVESKSGEVEDNSETVQSQEDRVMDSRDRMSAEANDTSQQMTSLTPESLNQAKAEESTEKAETIIDHQHCEVLTTADVSDAATIASECAVERDVSDVSDKQIVSPVDVTETSRKLSLQVDEKYTEVDASDKTNGSKIASPKIEEQSNESTSQLMETGKESPQITLTIESGEDEVKTRRQSVQATSVRVESDIMVTTSSGKVTEPSDAGDASDASASERRTSLRSGDLTDDPNEEQAPVQHIKPEGGEEDNGGQVIDRVAQEMTPQMKKSDSVSKDTDSQSTAVTGRRESIEARVSAQEEETSTVRDEGERDESEVIEKTEDEDGQTKDGDENTQDGDKKCSQHESKDTKSPEASLYSAIEEKSIESTHSGHEGDDVGEKDKDEQEHESVESEHRRVTSIQMDLPGEIDSQMDVRRESEKEEDTIGQLSPHSEEKIVEMAVCEREDKGDSPAKETMKGERQSIDDGAVKPGDDKTVPQCMTALSGSTSAFVASAPCNESPSGSDSRMQGDHDDQDDVDDSDSANDFSDFHREESAPDQVHLESETVAHVVVRVEEKDDKSYDEAKDLYNRVVEEVESLIERSGSTDLIKSISGEKLSTCTESTPSIIDDVKSSTDENVTAGEATTSQRAAPSTMGAILKDWGKPLGLPYPPINERNRSTSTTRFGGRSTSVKPARGKGEEIKNIVYLDLAYVPHHGNAHYCNADFFKRVRARYYVFSAVDPSKEVLDALIQAKSTWDDKDAQVTIVPTHETETLFNWMSMNQELLDANSIDVAPCASRCTVTLQDHETSCAAYRIEF